MPDAGTWLGFQCAAAVGGLACLRTLVAPHLREGDGPLLGVSCDVWIPATIYVPLALLAARVGPDVGGFGWMIVGAPTAAALAFGGAGLLARGRGGAPLPRAALGAALVAGIVVLLLGAAHRLDVWVGQALFAMAAVLLWRLASIETDRHAPTPGHLGIGVLGCAIAGVAQGWCALRAAGGHPAGVLLVWGVFVLASAAIVAAQGGRHWAIRAALGAGGAGTLFTIGALSLVRMVPLALMAMLGGPAPIGPPVVAYGFGRWAVEGAALVALVGAAVSADRWPVPARRVVGLAMIALAAWLGWRAVRG